MNIGDKVTWKQFVSAKSIRGKRVRFYHGVIVDERPTRNGREIEIAIRSVSGNLDFFPSAFVWVLEWDVISNRYKTKPAQTNWVSPLDLINRRANRDAQKKLDIILKNVANFTGSSNVFGQRKNTTC